MYGISGSFGQVRLCPQYHRPDPGVFDWIKIAGWHKVNSLYRIDRRASGCDTYELLFTVSGCGRAVIRGKPYTMIPDSLLILPVNVPYCYDAPEGETWEFYWIHVGGRNAVAVLDFLTAGGEYFRSLRLESVVDHFELLLNPKPANLNNPFFEAQMVSVLLFDILSAGKKNPNGEKLGAVAAQIARQIDENPQLPFSLSEICRKNFVSEESLIRAFHRETGTTPYQYYRRNRLVRASRLLAYTQLPVKEIAVSLGYSNLTSFSIQFRKEFGKTPTEYRAENKVYQN